MEKVAGSGDIQSGDDVFLTAWTGMRVTVGDFESGSLKRTAVHAKWNHKGGWQKLTVEKSGAAGPLVAGDEIFLQAWTGARIDADTPDSEGVVQARWDHKGDWQRLVVQADSPATTTTSVATTLAPATAESPTLPAVTTPPPASTTPLPVATTPQLGEDQEEVSAKEWEHFHLLNQLRAQGFTCPHGEAFEPNPVPLKFSCRLWRASKLHSEDMAAQSYFSHTSKDGRSPWQRAEEQGTDAHGENIAAGSSTAVAALEQWKKSDGHCKNMMRKHFRVAAVGYGAGGPLGHYWTQMFALHDTDIADLDTACYPAGVALMQREEVDVGKTFEKALAEAWSRSPA
jgi:uncharacterized protein YkwD